MRKQTSSSFYVNGIRELGSLCILCKITLYMNCYFDLFMREHRVTTKDELIKRGNTELEVCGARMKECFPTVGHKKSKTIVNPEVSRYL